MALLERRSTANSGIVADPLVQALLLRLPLILWVAGRLFDVIVLGRPGHTPEGSRMGTLEAALFESSRPVLIAPPSPRPQMGTNALVAWNCSTEQARTIAFAMPILRRASLQGHLLANCSTGLLWEPHTAHHAFA
jgi:hypothetical protein